MDIQQNYYQVFDLPLTYTVDLNDLAARYREIQRQVHPDKYADASERDQRLAVQYATYVNQAYETLKSSVKRAEYLLQLEGHPVDFQTVTTSDGEFLMQQMSLRDELSDVASQADPEAALDKLNQHVSKYAAQLESVFESAWQAKNLQQAQVAVAKLHFLDKLAVEIDQAEAKLLDY